MMVSVEGISETGFLELDGFTASRNADVLFGLA